MHAAPALLDTQRGFLAALYDDAEAGPLAAIVGNGLEAAARLRIYRHSCHEIQTAALRVTYPAVLALVGDDFFDHAARGYRAAYPSHGGNLQAFGGHFADYLAGLTAVQPLPYLRDVARLEWLRQQSALSGDPETLPSECRAPSGLHPCVRLLASPYPVLTIWRYAMQPTSGHLRLPDHGERIVMWREDDQVAMAVLDRASFACIEALARAATFEDACHVGLAQDRDFDIATCVESLVARGLIATIPSFDPAQEPLPCRPSGT